MAVDFEDSESDIEYNVNSLKCMYTNADSLLNKRSELVNVILKDQPDIIMIAEVLPKNVNEAIQPSELCFRDYEKSNIIYSHRLN